MDKRALKKKNIARACKDIFVEQGFNNVSVSEVAKTANIGKGTVYEYFTNKEDIVCELMDCLQEEYDVFFKTTISTIDNDEDKILALFDIFISDDIDYVQQKEIYKQFLLACLSKPSARLLQYHCAFRDKYAHAISSINNKLDSYKILDCVIGFFTMSQSLENYDLSATIKTFIHNEIRKPK